MRALRTLFLLAIAAALSSIAACTSGTTANCAPDAGGNPDATAWCGVPAGEGDGEAPETGPAETGAGDSATEAGGGPSSDAGHADTGTGAAEAAADAPPE